MDSEEMLYFLYLTCLLFAFITISKVAHEQLINKKFNQESLIFFFFNNCRSYRLGLVIIGVLLVLKLNT